MKSAVQPRSISKKPCNPLAFEDKSKTITNIALLTLGIGWAGYAFTAPHTCAEARAQFKHNQSRWEELQSTSGDISSKAQLEQRDKAWLRLQASEAAVYRLCQ